MVYFFTKNNKIPVYFGLEVNNFFINNLFERYYIHIVLVHNKDEHSFLKMVIDFCAAHTNNIYIYIYIYTHTCTNTYFYQYTFAYC